MSTSQCWSSEEDVVSWCPTMSDFVTKSASPDARCAVWDCSREDDCAFIVCHGERGKEMGTLHSNSVDQTIDDEDDQCNQNPDAVVSMMEVQQGQCSCLENDMDAEEDLVPACTERGERGEVKRFVDDESSDTGEDGLVEDEGIEGEADFREEGEVGDEHE